MHASLAQIDPEVLASALNAVEGRGYSASTPEDRQRLALRLGELLEDERLTDRLLHVLTEREEEQFKNVPKKLLGKVLMADGPSVGDPWADLNARMEALDAEPGGAAEKQHLVGSAGMKVPTPALLGFEDETVEPAASEAVRAADQLLLELEESVARLDTRSWLSRAYEAVCELGASKLTYRTQKVAGFTQVEVWRGRKRELQVSCLVSGRTLYLVAVVQDGAAVKHRFGLEAPTRSMALVADAFRNDAEVGAEAIHELRDVHLTWSDLASSSSGFGRPAL